MKKILHFGKIDFYNAGAKRNAVTVEIEYTEKQNGQKVFSVCGNIWNATHTDIICGGQCLEEIARYIKTPLFNEILRLWRLYHLNDMHPECTHQAAAGWLEQAGKRVKLYSFCLTTESITKQREIKSKVLAAAQNGESYIPTASEQTLLNMEYSITIPEESLPASLAAFYKPGKVEEKLCGWLKESEHPAGILCKPCPVCGYKYGTAWNYVAIPEQDEKIIYAILNGAEGGGYVV